MLEIASLEGVRIVSPREFIAGVIPGRPLWTSCERWARTDTDDRNRVKGAAERLLAL